MNEPWRYQVADYTITAEAAGDSYAALNPGQGQDGLAYGLIQWNQSSGDLGHLLLSMSDADPKLFLAVFGPSSPELLHVTNADDKTSRLAPVGGVVLTREPWLSRFRKAATFPVFQQAQDNLAANGLHMQKAIEAAKLLGTPTMRSLALAFDVAVFYGPYGVTKLAHIVADGPDASYRDTLRALAVADASRFLRTSAPPSNEASRWTRVGNAYHRLVGGRDWFQVALDRHMKIVNAPDLSDAPIDTRSTSAES